MEALNMEPTNQGRTLDQVEVCGGKKASRLKRSRTDVGTKPYARPNTKPYAKSYDKPYERPNAKPYDKPYEKPYVKPTKRQNSLNHSKEDDLFSNYMSSTNGQIVMKKNITRSPAGKSHEQKLTISKKSKSCLKRRSRAEFQNSQSVFKKEKKWKKLTRRARQEGEPATQRDFDHKKAKIRKAGGFMEFAIEQVMKKFQKITIQEGWQSWPENEI